MGRTFVICGNYTEFGVYLRNIERINEDVNRLRGYPFKYVAAAHTLEAYDRAKGDRIVLFRRFYDNPVYKAYETYRKVRNDPVHIEDPGPPQDGSVIRKNVLEESQKLKSMKKAERLKKFGPYSDQSPD